MVALVALIALVGAPTAMAQVTVGQTAPPGDPSPPCVFANPYDEFQTGVAAGNSYTVPAAGLLTSWSTNAGSTPGQTLGFKVFRPVAGSYLVVAQDPMRPLVSGALNTFPIAIPVLAGDLIGIYQPGGTTANCNFETAFAADTVVFKMGNVPPGGTVVPRKREAPNPKVA